MKLYTVQDLAKGAGLFDHVMRTAKEYPSRNNHMSGPVAIGVISAASASGLSNRDIGEVIERYFDADTSALLQKVRKMYDGADPRIHLWSLKGDKLELDAHLKWYSKPDWHLDRYALGTY